jgi:hypothetical protein
LELGSEFFRGGGVFAVVGLFCLAQDSALVAGLGLGAGLRFPVSDKKWGPPTVADSERQGVGGVGRFRGLSKSKDAGNHGGHLFLVRPAVSTDGFFDFAGGVEVDVDAALGGGEHEDTHAVGGVHDGGHIPAFKYAFDCYDVGLVLVKPIIDGFAEF